jgi:hypothetical protein
MAGAHALSHIGDRADDGLAQWVHCDLCLAAATHVAPQRAAASAPRAADAGLPPARAPPASA